MKKNVIQIISVIHLLLTIPVLAETQGISLFQACIRNKDCAYMAAVSNLLSNGDCSNIVARIKEDKTAPVLNRLQATILIARLENGSVFDDFHNTFEEAKLKSDAKSERGGYLSGHISSFAKLGPESVFAWQRIGEQQIGIMKAPRFAKVEKHTKREVEQGKNRNNAARLAIIEYFIKFSTNLTEYEMREFIDSLADLRTAATKSSGKAEATYIDGVFQTVLLDKSKPLTVRVAVADVLTYEKSKAMLDITELMFCVLESERLNDDRIRINRQTVCSACDFFKLYGTKKDLIRLRELQVNPAWRRELVNEAVEVLEVRMGKDVSAN